MALSHSIKHAAAALVALAVLQSVTGAQSTLLIITPQEFQASLQPLVNHKNATGLPTGMITLETITGAGGWAGVDAPEQIKRAIAFFEQTAGTRYVMLVGDSDKLPVRYTSAAETYGTSPDLSFGCTDLYYADLYIGNPSWRIFDDWNARQQGDHAAYFGEGHKTGDINYDQIDYLPDVAVGRVPASNAAEVQRYVQKVIAYEFSTFVRDIALVVGINGALEEGNQAYADGLAQSFSQHGVLPILAYQSSWGVPGTLPATSDWISTVMNLAGNFGCGLELMSISGHGSPAGWSPFGAANVAPLANLGNLPIIFSASCDIARFAPQGVSRTLAGSGGDAFLNVDDEEFDPRLGLLTFDGSNGAWPRSKLRAYKQTEARLTTGDIDGDGRDESVYVLDAGGVAVLVEQNHGGYTRIGDLRFPGTTGGKVATGNLDGDPAEELVVILQDASGRGTVLVYDWQGGVLQKIADLRFPDALCLGVTCGNLDGGPRDHFVVTMYDGVNRLAVLTYDLQGPFQAVREGDVRIDGAVDGAPDALDADADGRDEVVVTCRDSIGRPVVRLYDLVGSGLQQIDHVLFPTTCSGFSFASGDLLGDAREELVLVTQEGTTVLTRVLGLSLGQIGTIGILSTNNASDCLVAVGDLDASPGDEFVLAVQDGQDRVAILIHDVSSNGIVRIGDSRESLSRPIALAVGDWDPDPQAEVALYACRVAGRPRPPAPIQPSHLDVDSMAEEFLVKHQGGAVAFVGTSTGAQAWCLDLERRFFEAHLIHGETVLGDMWNRAINDYWSNHGLSNVWQNQSSCEGAQNCWARLAEFDTARKTMLFGDPSLRLR